MEYGFWMWSEMLRMDRRELVTLLLLLVLLLLLLCHTRDHFPPPLPTLPESSLSPTAINREGRESWRSFGGGLGWAGAIACWSYSRLAQTTTNQCNTYTHTHTPILMSAFPSLYRYDAWWFLYCLKSTVHLPNNFKWYTKLSWTHITQFIIICLCNPHVVPRLLPNIPPHPSYPLSLHSHSQFLCLWRLTTISHSIFAIIFQQVFDLERYASVQEFRVD